MKRTQWTSSSSTPCTERRRSTDDDKTRTVADTSALSRRMASLYWQCTLQQPASRRSNGAAVASSSDALQWSLKALAAVAAAARGSRTRWLSVRQSAMQGPCYCYRWCCCCCCCCSSNLRGATSSSTRNVDDQSQAQHAKWHYRLAATVSSTQFTRTGCEKGAREKPTSAVPIRCSFAWSSSADTRTVISTLYDHQHSYHRHGFVPPPPLERHWKQ